MLTDALILVLTGVAAAFLNTAASSGSAVSLPIMIAIGVEPLVANASNRLPIVIGCATAVWSFHRAGHLPWRDAARFCVPVGLGAAVGASLASVFDDVHTTNLVIVAVVVALLLLFANPAKWLSADRTDQPPNKGPRVLMLMGLVGVWAGMIAVDSGTYALATLVLAGRFPSGKPMRSKWRRWELRPWSPCSSSPVRATSTGGSPRCWRSAASSAPSSEPVWRSGRTRRNGFSAF